MHFLLKNNENMHKIVKILIFLVKICDFQGWWCRAGSDRYGMVPQGCGMCLRVKVRRIYVFLRCARVIVR